MRFTVLGASGSYPGPDSPASSYLVEADHEGRTWRVLVDLGSGALGALQRHVDPLAVDAVFLSHLHADHCLDLCGYYVLRKFHPAARPPRLRVWGPAGTSRRMAKAYDLDEDPGMNEQFEFRTYSGSVELGPFTVTPLEVAHPVPAYGLRIVADGRTLAYSGDTGPCSGVVETARDAEVFLCEASFLEGEDNPPDLHLTGAEAGIAATEAAARSLLLTHIPPWHDPAVVFAEARATYAGPLALAVAGQTYDV